jgi:tRNA pseudouridine55 synthase
MYSALKVNGRKLVDAARKGLEIERKPRHIDIYSIDLSQKDGGLYISVSCSRGTYIRTLCEDIGKKLKCLGCMGSLERTRVGDFYVESSVTLERLKEMTESERASLVIPVDAALSGFGRLEVDDFFARLIKDGNAVETQKLGVKNSVPGTLLRLYNDDKFFAVGEIAEKDGIMTLKHKKLFI